MNASPSAEHKKHQRGSFLPGLVVGLLVGLAIALGVALYVTKVPVPFVNKVPQRTADQDVAEAQRNRNWDPNAPLAGRTPGRPADAASAVAGGASAPMPPPPGVILPPPDPVLQTPPPVAAASKPAAAEPYTYFVQAGAFGRIEEAEQQRARLTMMDLEARVTEREQGGRLVYRVRVGPFDRKASAESTKTRLELEGIDASMVQVKN